MTQENNKHTSKNKPEKKDDRTETPEEPKKDIQDHPEKQNTG